MQYLDQLQHFTILEKDLFGAEALYRRAHTDGKITDEAYDKIKAELAVVGFRLGDVVEVLEELTKGAYKREE